MPKTFPSEMKPRKFPAKEKNWTRKAKVEGKEENESQVTGVIYYGQKNLLSAHARTLESDILHLEHKTRSARPVNKVFGILGSYI